MEEIIPVKRISKKEEELNKKLLREYKGHKKVYGTSWDRNNYKKVKWSYKNESI